MATLAKMVTKTLDVGVSNTTIDLSATIKSFDVLDTKFIFGITSNQGLAINLSGATVKYIVEYYVEGKTYAVEGNCLVVDINTISFNLPDQLRGYNGKALIGIYATLTDGTKIDIKNIVVNIEPSLMDKGTDFKARYYFESFDNVLASVKDAGNKAISQINTVLPGVQSKVAEIDRQIRSLPPIPDLFVAYADDADGGGFSKTDSSKLYKGFSVKNSNLPSDYRWERNVDNLQVGGRNLLLNSEVNESNMRYFEYGESTAEVVTEGSLKYYKIKINDGVSGNSHGIRFANNYGYYNLTKGKHYIFSYWIKVNVDYRFAFDSIGHHQVANGTNTHTEINSKYNVSRLTANKWTKITIEFDTTVDAFFIPYIWFVEAGMEICVYGFMLEEGNTPTTRSPAPEDTILNSNPINSILTTLSAENPSTTLGGTWTQLGTETKFSNTIYYWKRTN